jgi:ribosomal protein S18 acetylase RimI-like enzyme
VRPGTAADLDAITRLWAEEARDGRREHVPSRRWSAQVAAGFDFEARSRVVGDDPLEGAVLVTVREYDIGTITRIEVAVAARDMSLRRRLVEWGLGLSRAAGAAAAQVWLPRGQGDDLAELGMANVRPWWRMDRSIDTDLPAAEPVPGYRMLVGAEVAEGTWSDVHNRSFADHWRYSFRTEEELMPGRLPDLCLLAVEGAGEPAAVALGLLDSYVEDPRPQPVGIVGSIGTVPSHRRRGVARWLVAELLPRLRRAGARTSSLYVDGMNPTGAPALYRSLGFEVAFESEVWEATFP